MARRLFTLSAPVARRVAAVAGALAIGAALTPAVAVGWNAPEPAPVLDPSIIQPDAQLRLRDDDSAFFLARGLDVGSDDVSQPVFRPPGGPAAFASPFGGGFGQYSTTGLLLISPLDGAGNLLAIRQAAPYDAAFLAPGANPAAIFAEPTPARISKVDVAPSGEAAAILGGGSTASVSFRAAGPGGRFDTPRSLDRAGNQRSYGIAITVDPDGGVLAVYRTEQERAVFQAYAPPGGDFGPPQLIDIPTLTIASAGWEPIYAQSTNGHAMLVWSESTGGNSNAEQIWVATRRPGGPLGPKELVAEIPVGSRALSEDAAGITDDGVQYLAYRDFVPVSGCDTNIDGDGDAVLAVRSPGGSWTRTVASGAWPKRVVFQAIVTAGNRVGVAITRSTDTGARCESTDPTSSVGVRLGQGAALGPETTVATEGITNAKHGAAVTIDGFAVNSRGGAILLSDIPQAGGDRKRFLHFNPSSGPPAPPAPPAPKPLPAPGKIHLSGKVLKARGGKIPFEASCIRTQPGDKVYCHIGAILLEQERRRNGKASASAAGASASAAGAAAKGKPAKGKPAKGKGKPAKGKAKGKGRKKKAKAPKPKVLARAKQIRVAPGKRRKLTLNLNKLGKRQLKASRGGLRVTLRVTVRKGTQVSTIERKLTVKAAKPKAKGKGKRKAAKRRPAGGRKR